MGTVRLTLCLLIIMTLTTTWARTFLEVPKASEANRINENPSRRHWKKNVANDELIGSNVINDDGKDYYKHIIRYLRNKANELIRNDPRIGRRSRSLRGNEDNEEVPFSERRLQKMLEKAILKIITGDLSTADMLLLKSLNYSLDEVLAIRERELGKKIIESETAKVDKSTERATSLDAGKMDREENESERQSWTESSRGNHLDGNDDKVLINEDIARSTVASESTKKKKKHNEKPNEDFDFDAYNRQAVYDYENSANNMSQQTEFDPVTVDVDRENSFVDNREIVELDDDLRKNFDRAMESHVVFKIRYDDSEFDSRSDERVKQLSKERGVAEAKKRPRYDFMVTHKSHDRSVESVSAKTEFSSSSAINATPENPRNNTFQESTVDLRSSLPVVYRLTNFVTPIERIDETAIDEGKNMENVDEDFFAEARNDSAKSAKSRAENVKVNSSVEESDKSRDDRLQADLLTKKQFSDDLKRINMYEGLEWVEDDVYRVIPEAVDSLDYDGNAIYLENETIEDSDGNGTRRIDADSRIDDESNDTINYQNENPDDVIQTQISTNSSTRNQPNANLSAYQQLALAHRRDSNLTSTYDSQGQKAIEDIKLKVLAMTGRFNLSSSSNQVQRERLTLFSPICQVPKNTDSEAWSDAFSMNMLFQLNLTSGDHVVAAKLRIYKLAQDNVTLPNSAVAEEEDEEEKKIRISVYFYTKSLKKHRSKKRLMDSVVTALTTEGSHLALDVRQALRFWRQNLRNTHGNNNNHGLVIQVEDQDGRPLKPAQYIEQDSCHGTERNQDDKAYQRVPALFVQACSRYVRVVNGEAVTYVNCSKSSRNGRH